jgi:hypothetical protein
MESAVCVFPRDPINLSGWLLYIGMGKNLSWFSPARIIQQKKLSKLISRDGELKKPFALPSKPLIWKTFVFLLTNASKTCMPS